MMKRKVNALIKTLQEHQLTIAFAESMTCGLATHQLTTLKGTSEVLIGGVICYHEKSKTQLLNVSESLIKKYTAESQQVTDSLAKNFSRIVNADLIAAVTGLSSPGGSESKKKPVGTVFFSVIFKRRVYRERKCFKGTPLEIRRKTCEALYEFVTGIVRKQVR